MESPTKIQYAIWSIKNHLRWFWGVYIILFVMIAIICLAAWYEYAFPCVRGHHEDTMHYIQDGRGMITGSYWSNDFVCDCRTVRDSL